MRRPDGAVGRLPGGPPWPGASARRAARAGARPPESPRTPPVGGSARHARTCVCDMRLPGALGAGYLRPTGRYTCADAHRHRIGGSGRVAPDRGTASGPDEGRTSQLRGRSSARSAMTSHDGISTMGSPPWVCLQINPPEAVRSRVPAGGATPGPEPAGPSVAGTAPRTAEMRPALATTAWRGRRRARAASRHGGDVHASPGPLRPGRHDRASFAGPAPKTARCHRAAACRPPGRAARVNGCDDRLLNRGPECEPHARQLTGTRS